MFHHLAVKHLVTNVLVSRGYYSLTDVGLDRVLLTYLLTYLLLMFVHTMICLIVGGAHSVF